MEMTLGKRPRTQPSTGASVDDTTLLRAVESLDPTRGSVDVVARRWQQVTECVVADTGDDASAELCRKRYEELINDDISEGLEHSDEVKAALVKHKAWLQTKRLSGAVEAEETASTGGLEEKATGSDVDGGKRPRKSPIPLKRGGGTSPVIKTEAGLSMVSPPASGKRRKTSLSPATVVAREKRKSLLARVTATLDRHEKRPSSTDDAMESLAARVARNPQEVRVIPPLARTSPVSKASPVESPAKSREQARLEKPKPNDVFFSPVKAARTKEETKVAVVETKVAVVVTEATGEASSSSGAAAQDQGSEKRELTPEKILRAATTPPSTVTRSNVRKVVKALGDALTAVATTPPRPPRVGEVDDVDMETHEMKAAGSPDIPAQVASSSSLVSEPPRADETEVTVGSEVMEAAGEEQVQDSQATGEQDTAPDTAPGPNTPSREEPTDVEMPSAEDVEVEGEAEQGGSSPSPSIEFVAEEEDPGEAQSVTESTRPEPQESFASREEFGELKRTVAMLVSSLTESRTEQTELKSDLAGTQQCLRICEGMCVVLQQQVGTLSSSLSDAQVRNAKLHEEVILLREEIQRGRAARLQELADVQSNKPTEAAVTASVSPSLPSELHDIREALRVHMETVMAAQETRKAAVGAGFGVIDSQLQQLQAAIDRGEKKHEELTATIASMRSSFESQLKDQEKKFQTMLEDEQQSREEVLATVEREREELERERRKQYQQYQARVDEEQRRREQMLTTFNEKSQRELERLRDVADVNLRVRNELLFKVKAEREEAKTQNVDRVQAVEEKMATLNESLIGVQVGLREHRAEARATKTSQQQVLETLKHHVEQLQATLDNKPSSDEYMKTGDGSQDTYGLSRKVEALSASLAQLQDSLSKQKQANKLRAMEQDSQTKIEWSELRRTLETERSERMRDFSKLLTIVRQSQAGGGNESE